MTGFVFSGMRRRSVRVAGLCGLFCLLLFCAGVPAAPGRDGAAIASAHPLATDAGYRILREGGNAFDAAIAVGAALAVVEPYSSGLGGGGFWLLHRAADNHQVMIDGRETAPAAVTQSLFVDASGKPIANATHNEIGRAHV